MKVDIKDVLKLREQTSCGMVDCKEALGQAKGNFEEAILILRKKGKATAAKKSDRVTGEGVIQSYIHGTGKVGVLVEVGCETDFVAKNQEFKAFAHEVALQITATRPLYVSREDVPADILAKEREIIAESVLHEKKPDNVINKIIEGKLEKFYSEVVLLEQPYIKEEKTKISDLLTDLIGKTGENVRIVRFVRYALGEE